VSLSLPGRYTGLDKVWQDAFADYLVEMCLSDQFQWDLNPDSSDTGGLFQVRGGS
jgi:endoglucanase